MTQISHRPCTYMSWLLPNLPGDLSDRDRIFGARRVFRPLLLNFMITLNRFARVTGTVGHFSR